MLKNPNIRTNSESLVALCNYKVALSPDPPSFSVFHASHFSVCNIENLGGPGDEANCKPLFSCITTI